MPPLLYVLLITALTCLSGVGAFALLWPRDTTKHRPFRSWPITLLLLGLAAPAIAAVPIFTADFLTDNGLAWLENAFYAASATSLILIAVALVGDRSRGRRRCPRCWYDMGATSGLTCSECGHTARRERSLFRARRRKSLVLVALTPALASLIPWNALYYRGPDWAKDLSNTALVLAAPFAHRSLKLTTALEESIPISRPERTPQPRDFSRWQKAALIHFAHRGLSDTDHPRRVLTSCEILLAYTADDRATVDALANLAATSPMYERRAIELLGRVEGDPAAAKSVLIGKLSASPATAYLAAVALTGVIHRAPGGPPPGALFSPVRAGATYSVDHLVQLLRWFDPCEESRSVLTTAMIDRRTRPAALVSLAALWPTDPEYQRLMLVNVQTSGEPTMESEATQVVYGLLFDEMTRRDNAGGIAPARLAVYTPELCDELEKWLPLLDHNDDAYSRLPGRRFGDLLRQILHDARAAHARR